MISVLNYIGCSIVIIGCVFNILSAIGCIRMPNFYTQLHAAGVGDSCGSILALLGLILVNGFNLISLKIFLLKAVEEEFINIDESIPICIRLSF